jgi:heterotetrameric sarcosine oxidase delta subunit
MRIRCPYCGERSNDEFSVLGDADALVERPSDGDPATFHNYVYLRANPAGSHRELWYHAAGCRRWIVVTRDTRTHAVLSTELAASRGSGDTAP